MVRFPISEGIAPTKELISILKLVNSLSWPIVVGIVDSILLLNRCRRFKKENDPILDGREPVKLATFNLSWAILQLLVVHVIPGHSVGVQGLGRLKFQRFPAVQCVDPLVALYNSYSALYSTVEKQPYTV